MSSFAVTFDELRSIIAVQQGYGRDPAGWNDNQLYVINDVTTSGIAQVYFPPPVNGEKIAPDWTFLKPQSTIHLDSGASSIRLPDDFGSFVGPLTVVSSTSVSAPWLIEWINLGKIQQMQQLEPSRTGPPLYACEAPLRDINAPVGQRKSLVIFPTSDAAYDIRCVYSINPDRITGATPYCYGGPQYRELYIESCLSIAEQRFDDTMDGPHTMKFQMMLLGAVSADNKNRPQKLGYNGNAQRGGRWNRHGYWNRGQLTYNGQPFE